jgi:integrase
LSRPVKRSGSANWYYRESIPTDIRDLLIRRGERAPKEVWATLGTPDIRLAKAKIVQVQADQHREWNALREAAKPVGRIPTSAELVEPVLDHVHKQFEEVHRRNLGDAMRDGLDLAGEAKRRRDKIVQVNLLPTADDRAAMELVASVLCREVGWDLGPGEGVKGERWNELVSLVTRAIQHARSRVADTLEGRAVIEDREAVMAHLGGKHRPKAKAGETLLELFDLYKADRLREGKSADTLETERKVVGHFAILVGPNRSVADIGRADIREFKRALCRVPRRWTTRAELKGMTIAEAANEWEKLGGEGRKQQTINKELSAISSIFTWMIKNAYYDGVNPTRDFFDSIDKTEGKYLPYTDEQLKAVFRSPLFVGCDKTRPHIAGSHQVRDWRYWLPLCALYSGARAGEIAQLLCADVRQEEGVWVFDLNEVADDETSKSLKTRSSRRLVPLHPVLLALGFDQYAVRTRAAGHIQLFPEIKPGPRGDMGYMPSKFWQRYLKRIEVKEDRLCFHSFRHTFTDECRRRGIAKEVLRALLGHADSSITGHYGTLADGNLQQRTAAIRSLSYGELHAEAAEEVQQAA